MKLESLLSPEARNKLKKLIEKTPYHWDRPRTLLTITGFEAIHAYGQSGCNSEAGLIELMTMYREIADMRVKMSKGYFQIYLQYAVTQSPQGFGRKMLEDRGTKYFLVIRKDKKTEEVFLNENDELPYKIRNIIGDAGEKRIKKSYFRLSDITKISDFKNLEEHEKNNALIKELSAHGWRITDAFEYHESLYIRPKFINIKGTTIEFGIMTNHTYHSLPRVYKFDFIPKVKTVNLAELGIEDKGYYSHHTRHFILDKDKDRALAFNKNFNKKMNKG